MAALKHAYRANSGGQSKALFWPLSYLEGTAMLIAYLDEFGHQGPYIRHDHKKFNTHPVFGYAGYLIPSHSVRQFGGYFEYVKEQLLDWEITQANAHPRRWEKKGSALFTTANIREYKDEINPATKRLYRKLGNLGGQLFFFGQEKPIGPVSVTKETSQEREEHCLIQAINRLGRIATKANEELLVIMDATDTDNRERAVATLGKTIYSKTNKDNRSIIEVPIQADSHLYGTIQFADWTCALLGRLTDYHFAERSQFAWSVDLCRDVFKRCSPSSNSIIWSNSTDHSLKCSPKHLINTTKFWEIAAEHEARNKRRMQGNQQMLQRIVSAGSLTYNGS